MKIQLGIRLFGMLIWKSKFNIIWIIEKKESIFVPELRIRKNEL